MSRLIPAKLLKVQPLTGIPPGSRRSHKQLTESNPLLNTTQKGKTGWFWDEHGVPRLRACTYPAKFKRARH